MVPQVFSLKGDQTFTVIGIRCNKIYREILASVRMTAQTQDY